MAPKTYPNFPIPSMIAPLFSMKLDSGAVLLKENVPRTNICDENPSTGELPFLCEKRQF
jgi:hypothetical protein